MILSLTYTYLENKKSGPQRLSWTTVIPKEWSDNS